MTGLIIFIAVAVIAIGYVIYKKRNPTISEPKEFIPVETGGTSAPIEGTVYWGGSNPSAPDGQFACDNPLKIRKYFVVKDITPGQIVYDGEQYGSPTNGGKKWMALIDDNDVSTVVQIDTNGKIMAIFPC